MISFLKSLYWKWYYWRLFRNLKDCLEHEANARELQEIGKLMRECGEKHNIASWIEEGSRIELNAETIILERNVKFVR